MNEAIARKAWRADRVYINMGKTWHWPSNTCRCTSVGVVYRSAARRVCGNSRSSAGFVGYAAGFAALCARYTISSRSTSSSPASTKSGGRPPRLPASAGEQSGCRSCAFVAYSWICDLIGAAVPSACVMYSGRACHGPLASTDSPAFLPRKRRSRPVVRTNAPASRGSGHKTLGRWRKLYGGM